MTTTAHPTRRQARLIHGDPSTTVETMPATKVELISPMEAASLSHSGRWTAASSSGVPKFFTIRSFSTEVMTLRHQGREDQHPEQAEPAAPQHDQADAGGDERGDALEEQVERRVASASGRASKALDQVALEPDEGVRRAGGDQQAEQDEQHADDEVEHVRRRAHVLVGRRLVDHGGHRLRRRRRLPAPPVPARRVGDRAEDEDDHGDDRVRRRVHGDEDPAHRPRPEPAEASGDGRARGSGGGACRCLVSVVSAGHVRGAKRRPDAAAPRGVCCSWL